MLCQGGEKGRALSPKSRVLLSGILTHTLAVQVAWSLSAHCHVETIVGLSTLSPQDTAMPPRIAFLLRGMPNFQWIHDDALFSQERWDRTIKSVRPTHVIHFEATTMLSQKVLAATPPTILVRESMETLDRLGRALVAWQSHERRERNPVRLLYVTTPLSQDESFYQSGAVVSIYPLLLRTFRKHYHLDAMHLELPLIYGPFPESALLAESLLPFVPPGSNVNDTSLLPGQTLAHVDDCVVSLVACLTSPKLKTPELPRIQVPDKFRTNAKDIATALRRHLNEESFKLINERTQLILSWHHHTIHPFDDASNVYSDTTKTFFRKVLAMTNRRVTSGRTEGMSLLQLRQQHPQSLVPCASECAVNNSPCQETSALAPLLPLSQNITQTCRFVLFTTDFSRSMTDLPVVDDIANVPWARHMLCQVAFVSGKSTLVQSLLQTSKEPQPELDVQSLNGRLQHRTWTLLWLPDDDEVSLSEADLLFPKLSPRPFFSGSVTKSMYIQPGRKLTNLPPLPIIYFVLSKQLDAKKVEGRIRYVKRSGTSVVVPVTVPHTPPRHVALLTHSLGLPQELVESGSIQSLAKFLLKKKNMPFTNRTLPLRQAQYYDFCKTEQYDMEFVDTFVLIHNLESDRSRRVRCEWYEEHLFWADRHHSNRHLEDFSLAHVLGKWRAEQRLQSNDDWNEEWGERIVDQAKGDLVDVSSISASSGLLQPSQFFVKIQGRIIKDG